MIQKSSTDTVVWGPGPSSTRGFTCTEKPGAPTTVCSLGPGPFIYKKFHLYGEPWRPSDGIWLHHNTNAPVSSTSFSIHQGPGQELHQSFYVQRYKYTQRRVTVSGRCWLIWLCVIIDNQTFFYHTFNRFSDKDWQTTSGPDEIFSNASGNVSP